MLWIFMTAALSFALPPKRPAPTAAIMRPTLIPGSAVTVSVPDGFLPSASVAGLESSGLSTVITTERRPKTGDAAGPLTLDTLPAMLTRAGRKPQPGEQLRVGGKAARLVFVDDTRGRLYVLGVDTGSTLDLVIASFKNAADRERVRAIMVSTKISDVKNDPFASAPVRLDVAAPLKLYQAVGGSILFTPGAVRNGLPSLTVMFSPLDKEPVPTDETVAAAYERFAPGQRAVKSVRRNGLKGLTAWNVTGSGEAGATKISFEGILAVAHGKIVIAEIATVTARAAEDLPPLRKALNSLRPNP